MVMGAGQEISSALESFSNGNQLTTHFLIIGVPFRAAFRSELRPGTLCAYHSRRAELFERRGMDNNMLAFSNPLATAWKDIVDHQPNQNGGVAGELAVTPTVSWTGRCVSRNLGVSETPPATTTHG